MVRRVFLPSCLCLVYWEANLWDTRWVLHNVVATRDVGMGYTPCGGGNGANGRTRRKRESRKKDVANNLTDNYLLCGKMA